MSSEQKHHPFGPSVMRRRELCPASMRLEEGLPSQTSPDAERGTLIHARVAEMIAEGSAETPSKIEGVTEDINELASMCYDYFLSVTGDRTLPEKYETERRLQYLIGGQVFYFGTADVLILTQYEDGKQSGILIDWKTGYKSVEPAQDNIQGAAYALAAMQEFNLAECEVHFYNPTLREESSYKFKDRGALENHIIGIYNTTQKADIQPVPGDEQCRYCKAFQQATCPAVKKELEVIADTATKIEGGIAKLPDDRLVEFYQKAKIVAKLEGVAEAEIKRRCEESGVCGSYRIKETSGGFEITNIPAAFELADKLTDKEFLDCCKLSESQLKKAWAKSQKEAGRYATQKEAEAAFQQFFAGLRIPKPPKKALVMKEDTKALN
ncbi:MAG: DUF2800 domain-containing protein [Verrucomicrobia bacterium]|nr:DUF2800 domain-containing protein [Verrucomicrobiota bacterium]